MKRKSLVLMVVTLIATVAASYAAVDAFMGTWKLNEAKSKIAAGQTKNTMVVYSASGDSIKVVTDGTDGAGKPVHTEWTGKYDGKDYAATGDSSADTRSYRLVNDHTLTITTRKAGKVVQTIRVVISADGKTRTVTTTGTDEKGIKFTSTAVYDKQ